jgi:hypothetical protein
MKMTHTTAKYPKYDENLLARTKSAETKQILKANAKQTHYGKTKLDSRTLRKLYLNDLGFNIIFD